MSNHLFMRIASVSIFLILLLSIPALLPAQEKSTLSRATTSRININTANESQLAELPGIGPAIAERIVRHRQEIGPYKTPEDIKQVKGIGDKIFLKIKNLIVTDQTS